MGKRKTIVVGSRGSQLALTQTGLLIDELRKAYPEKEFKIEIIKTKGDAGQIHEVGAFIKELEFALLEKKIDMAIHSMKDIPTEEVDGLTFAAMSKREDVRDILISRNGKILKELTQGAIIGTGSPRRELQLKSIRPDLQIKHIQGNVNTRIQKMRDGEYDAIVLAAAGLIRLNMQDEITEYLDLEEMIPAVGQGVLTVQTRADDNELIAIAQKVNNPDSQIAVYIERHILKGLGGGCRSPLAAYVMINGEQIQINSVAADLDYKNKRKVSLFGNKKDYKILAENVVKQLKIPSLLGEG